MIKLYSEQYINKTYLIVSCTLFNLVAVYEPVRISIQLFPVSLLILFFSDYYQWVSLVLALQAILCYLPRLIWEAITFNRVGTNLGFLLESAREASKETGKERSNRVQFIANVMDTLLGTALVTYYMIIKSFYLLNAVGQLLLMERFLGVRGEYRLFGLSILSDLIMGRHWNETSVFPRVGFCRVPIKLTSTPIPMVTVQCTLPVNMLNEKIYVFLWFWFVFVASLEVASIGVWICRLAARQSRLRSLIRYLKVADVYEESMDPLLARFELTFLRMDGSFLLQMMRLNAGSLITQEILQAMLKRYTEQEQYAQKKRVERQPSGPKSVEMEKDGLLPDSPDCTVTKLKTSSVKHKIIELEGRQNNSGTM
ncbi:unnamed protein product [Schistosoma curassoni]|uniref:Innexin n=1 Tax=Schistosoma curassoni TaxID=6186 RepID=A0A183JIT3_9TREM|nr:unnamed protein product [Schistosoma curassoni]